MPDPAPLYPVSRQHLEILTDEIGIMQHAIGSRPDPIHGYCTDDVARALLVDLIHQRRAGLGRRRGQRAPNLEFLAEAFDPASGRFRNFRRVDGSWLDETASEDSHGRAMLALGETMATAPNAALVEAAASLFEEALPAAVALTALRARASVILGCDAAMRRAAHSPSDGPTAVAYRALAGSLRSTFESSSASAWPWPEVSLTYENALPVHALIVAGRHFDSRVMVDAGLRVLDWLIQVQTAPEGHFSPVGNRWWPQGGEKSSFDQQPIEATCLLRAAEIGLVRDRQPRVSTCDGTGLRMVPRRERPGGLHRGSGAWRELRRPHAARGQHQPGGGVHAHVADRARAHSVDAGRQRRFLTPARVQPGTRLGGAIGAPVRRRTIRFDMPDRTRISLVVNGTGRAVEVRRGARLLDLLRDGLDLTGTKEGCDDGTCGTCTVLVDGAAVRACRKTAAEVAGREVQTIEGLGTPDRLHALHRAFLAADAVHCGFCTPGMVMAAAGLLKKNPHPSHAEIVRGLGSNLCRCTGYQGIVDAVEWVANGEQGSPRTWPMVPGRAPAGDAPAGDAAAGRAATGCGRIDALDKVTGRARYAADLKLAGMLEARVLRSPHAHADIVRIDASRALALPGVEAVLTAKDVTGQNSYGRKRKDEPVLAESRVRRVGDPVALVVAVSADVAAAALDLIDVEYRLLPAVFTPVDALADGAPQIYPGGNLLAENWLRHGDVGAALAASEIVVDETYSTPWNEHAYLEPEAVVASIEGNSLVVRTATQDPWYYRSEVARTTGWPADRVRIEPTVVGGAFGGKTDIAGQCLAALAATAVGRPVRIVFSRAESFATTTKRHPFRIHCRAGATRDGQLTALQVDMVADTGAYASSGPGRMIKAFSSATGPYRWPSFELHGRVVHTNNPTAGSMRGPGTTQVAFALEAHMDLMAERLGMDPLDFRLKNRLRNGDRLVSGQVLDHEPAVGATIEAIRPAWREALERCEASRAGSGGRRRGVGVASIWYGIRGEPRGEHRLDTDAEGTNRARPRTPRRVELDLLPDGTVGLRASTMDLGQGSATALAVIVAEELGMLAGDVVVSAGSTATHPDSGATGASKATFVVGNAARDAARALRRAALETGAGLLECAIDDLELREGAVNVRGNVGAVGRVPFAAIATERARTSLPNIFEGICNSETAAFDPINGTAEVCLAYVTATQLAEVEVDTETGKIRVIRVVAAHDVGRPVFVPGVVGQVEGGIVMGLGLALTEDFVPGETRGFKQYRVPRTRDVPDMVTLLVRADNEAAALQPKGVGECSNMAVAPAIINAIAHATGQRIHDLPARLRREAHHEADDPGDPAGPPRTRRAT